MLYNVIGAFFAIAGFALIGLWHRNDFYQKYNNSEPSYSSLWKQRVAQLLLLILGNTFLFMCIVILNFNDTDASANTLDRELLSVLAIVMVIGIQRWLYKLNNSR